MNQIIPGEQAYFGGFSPGVVSSTQQTTCGLITSSAVYSFRPAKRGDAVEEEIKMVITDILHP